MATLSFEGDTHREIVRQVRRWLESAGDAAPDDAAADAPAAVQAVTQAVVRASELTKDALTVVAERAPEPVARNDVVKALTRMGYDATDATKRAVVGALDALAGNGSDAVVKRIQQARNNVLYEMEAAAAKQVLRALRGQ